MRQHNELPGSGGCGLSLSIAHHNRRQSELLVGLQQKALTTGGRGGRLGCQQVAAVADGGGLGGCASQNTLLAERMQACSQVSLHQGHGLHGLSGWQGNEQWGVEAGRGGTRDAVGLTCGGGRGGGCQQVAAIAHGDRLGGCRGGGGRQQVAAVANGLSARGCRPITQHPLILRS